METCNAFITRKNKQWTAEMTNLKHKGIPMKDIGRQGKHFFKREAWTFMPQWDLPEKVFVIERLKKICLEGASIHQKASRLGETQYRIGYYMVGKIGRMHGKWTWGQYCPMIPIKDFEKLLKKAREEKTLI